MRSTPRQPATGIPHSHSSAPAPKAEDIGVEGLQTRSPLSHFRLFDHFFYVQNPVTERALPHSIGHNWGSNRQGMPLTNCLRTTGVN